MFASQNADVRISLHPTGTADLVCNLLS